MPGSEPLPLAARRCARCAPGTPPLGRAAIAALLPQLPGWSVEESGPQPALTRRFEFKAFMPAMDFANRIAAVAEVEGHHPELVIGWGYVIVRSWTHVAGGLTENDFILAAKVDRELVGKN